MIYILNLIILLVILYRIFIGIEGGLFNEMINLVNFIFSAGMSFIIFRSLGPYIEEYIFPNQRYALVIAFWALFILFISILWSIKQLFFSKIYSMTKEKPVPLPILVDKIGGAICGIILALKIMGCIIIFLYIAPVTKDLYSLHKEGKIIFKTDEKWVSFKKFDWENFLNNLKPEEKSLGTEKEQKTTKEEPKEE